MSADIIKLARECGAKTESIRDEFGVRIRTEILFERADQLADFAASLRTPDSSAPAESQEAQEAARYRWLRSIDSHAEWNRVGHYASNALDKIIDEAIQAALAANGAP